MEYRFKTADGTKAGLWRKSLAAALIDAVKHLKGWDRPWHGVRIGIDAAVAMTFLDDLKAAGYRFEEARRK